MAGSARFRPVYAALWAATWGLGVALGVAAGGWLTVIGGAGTPGVAALDVGEDLVVLPLAAGGLVFMVHFLGQAVVFIVSRRNATSEIDGDNENSESAIDHGVDW